MDMNMDIDNNPHFYYLCNTSIRAYSFFTITTPHPYRPRTLTRALRFYHPLPYPYTWYASRHQAAIVNIVDLYEYYETHHHHHQQPPPSTSATPPPPRLDDVEDLPYPNLVLGEDAILQYQINRSFQESQDRQTYSGLTKDVIAKKLKIENFKDCEESKEVEICVICQVGFEKDETIGVLNCKHRYHAECIQQWLVYKNVCPLCKANAFT